MLSVTNPDEAIAKFANVPQLFVFGRKKRAMFHSQFYLDKLEATDGCAYKEYSDAGHWVHVSHYDEMAADVQKFLDSQLM
jgi:pimeloyl-ACP methyl ester carboxylesterase